MSYLDTYSNRLQWLFSDVSTCSDERINSKSVILQHALAIRWKLLSLLNSCHGVESFSTGEPTFAQWETLLPLLLKVPEKLLLFKVFIVPLAGPIMQAHMLRDTRWLNLAMTSIMAFGNVSLSVLKCTPWRLSLAKLGQHIVSAFNPWS